MKQKRFTECGLENQLDLAKEIFDGCHYNLVVNQDLRNLIDPSKKETLTELTSLQHYVIKFSTNTQPLIC